MIRLRALREKAEMTQVQLAKLSGVPQQTISMIESGDRKNPGIETLYPICKVLGCSLDDMCTQDDEEKSVNVDAFEE